MAVVTTQTINRYYDDYKNTEITFSKEIIHTLKMDPRQIYIKSSGSQWPCIINSTSFSTAKIILGTKGGAYQLIAKKDPPPVSIRFSFYQADGQLMSFFVAAKVQSIQPYMNSSDLAIITLQYTQRPPDDLILMVGNLLDANINAIRRKEERIIITQESMRKLGIPKKESLIVVQNVPRHCILQDLSFGGVKVILLGLAQFLMNKEAVIQIEFDDPHETLTLRGTIVGANFIEGRKDIISASIKFLEESISMSYKIHINRYLTSIRKTELNSKFADKETEAPLIPVAEPAEEKKESEETEKPKDSTESSETPKAESESGTTAPEATSEKETSEEKTPEKETPEQK